MSGAVNRSGALEGEVIPAGESSLTGWEPSQTRWEPTRMERRVIGQGLLRQRQTEVRAQLTVHAVQTAAAVHEGCREILHTVLKSNLADHKTMTNPLETRLRR